MPFYKRNNDELISAPNFVIGPDFELKAETKEDHTYPVDGWYWFDTLDAAMAGMSNIPVAGTVTMRQARLALLAAGLLDQVTTAIAGLPSPQREAAEIEWEYAAVVYRDSGLVPAMASTLGLTEQQIDDLFVAANKI